jgi:hypothetical protein
MGKGWDGRSRRCRPGEKNQAGENLKNPYRVRLVDLIEDGEVTEHPPDVETLPAPVIDDRRKSS